MDIIRTLIHFWQPWSNTALMALANVNRFPPNIWNDSSEEFIAAECVARRCNEGATECCPLAKGDECTALLSAMFMDMWLECRSRNAKLYKKYDETNRYECWLQKSRVQDIGTTSNADTVRSWHQLTHVIYTCFKPGIHIHDLAHLWSKSTVANEPACGCPAYIATAELNFMVTTRPSDAVNTPSKTPQRLSNVSFDRCNCSRWGQNTIASTLASTGLCGNWSTSGVWLPVILGFRLNLQNVTNLNTDVTWKKMG